MTELPGGPYTLVVSCCRRWDFWRNRWPAVAGAWSADQMEYTARRMDEAWGAYLDATQRAMGVRLAM